MVALACEVDRDFTKLGIEIAASTPTMATSASAVTSGRTSIRFSQNNGFGVGRGVLKYASSFWRRSSERLRGTAFVAHQSDGQQQAAVQFLQLGVPRNRPAQQLGLLGRQFAEQQRGDARLDL